MPRKTKRSKPSPPASQTRRSRSRRESSGDVEMAVIDRTPAPSSSDVTMLERMELTPSAPGAGLAASRSPIVSRYSYRPPSINAMIKYVIETSSSHKDAFMCVGDQVRVRLPGEKEGSCLRFTNTRAQKLLLRLLNRKYPYSGIMAPKQAHSNCWFNVMCMVFFVSDAGAKMTKAMRHMMITGKNPETGEGMTEKKHRILFMLNRCIQDIFSGNKNGMVENTNVIIMGMFDILQKSKTAHVPNYGDYGNPLAYINAIHRFVGFAPANFLTISVPDSAYDSDEKGFYASEFEVIMHRDKAPDSISLFMMNRPVPPKLGKTVWYDAAEYDVLFSPSKADKESPNVYEYRLDSCIIRDTGANHLMGFLTYGGEELMFDGHTRSRIKKYRWKNRIHSDKDMVFQSGPRAQSFNFSKEYRVFLYYRVKKHTSISSSVSL
jgi:hypothetical protein